jgi:hypothetical protein
MATSAPTTGPKPDYQPNIAPDAKLSEKAPQEVVVNAGAGSTDTIVRQDMSSPYPTGTPQTSTGMLADTSSTVMDSPSLYTPSYDINNVTYRQMLDNLQPYSPLLGSPAPSTIDTSDMVGATLPPPDTTILPSEGGLSLGSTGPGGTNVGAPFVGAPDASGTKVGTPDASGTKISPPEDSGINTGNVTIGNTIDGATMSGITAATPDPGSTALSQDQINLILILTSAASPAILAYLTKIFPSADPAQLTALAAAIAKNNYPGGSTALDSDDEATVEAELKAIDPSIDPSLASSLASQIAGANTQRVQDLNSTNTGVVMAALQATLAQSLVQNPVSPSNGPIVLNGLAAMCAAFQFLTQLRLDVSQLESKFAGTQQSAETDISNEMASMAMSSYTLAINNAEQQLQQVEAQEAAEAKARKKAKLWGILGPIISGLLAVVAVVATVASMGTAAPAMLALVIVTQVALAGLTISDQTTGWMTTALQKAGIQSTALQDLVKFAVMAAVVVAGGIGTAVAGALSTMTTEVAAQATATAIKALVEMVISSLMSSGLLTVGFTAMCEAMGMNDQDAAIVATILTLITMLVMMYAAVKVIGSMAGSAATSTASSAAGGATAASSATDVAVEDTSEAAEQQAAKQAEQTVLTTLKNIMGALKNSPLLSASMVTSILQLITSIMQMIGSIQQAMSDSDIAAIDKDLASMKTELAQITGALDLAQSSQNQLNTSIPNSLDAIKAVNTLCTDMIQIMQTMFQSLSADVAQATQSG